MMWMTSMKGTQSRCTREAMVSRLLLPLFLLGSAGCGALDVSDPTAIEDAELDNAAGAQLLRGDALGQFYRAYGDLALRTGQLTDEFTVITPGAASAIPSLILLAQWADRRVDETGGFEFTFRTVLYPQWPKLRWTATVALGKLRSYGSSAHAAEMLALRGQATLQLAENFCPGFPSTELVGGKVLPGAPLTTEQAFERALVDFDSALALAADSARVLNFVRVGRAAALLGLGRFTEATEAATDVPTPYVWDAQYASGVSSARNPLLFTRAFSLSEYTTIADHEGGNGLDFLSTDDPRVEAQPLGTTDDGITPWHNPAKYADESAPIVVASGVEARLIEAEAALATGGDWLGILNTLRATQVSPALDPLTDPGTDAARVDLLFRERAFWLYATGKRLSDLRRLVRLYGRDPESVFPTGAYHQHGEVYGTATSLPFDPALESPFNPAVTGCTGP